MGYDTTFSGSITITPEIKEEHRKYLNAFQRQRHIRWKEKVVGGRPDPLREAVGLPFGPEGTFFVGSDDHYNNDLAIDFNQPPEGVPGLWCNWEVLDDSTLTWSGMEKFYDYVEWMRFLIVNFFQPWGYTLEGTISWSGEDPGDVGTIGVYNNEVRTHEYVTPALQDIFPEMGKAPTKEISTDTFERLALINSFFETLYVKFPFPGTWADRFLYLVRSIAAGKLFDIDLDYERERDLRGVLSNLFPKDHKVWNHIRIVGGIKDITH